MNYSVTVVLKNGLCLEYSVQEMLIGADEYISNLGEAVRDGNKGVIVPSDDGAIMLNLDEISAIQVREAPKRPQKASKSKTKAKECHDTAKDTK